MPYADPKRRKDYQKQYAKTYYPEHKEEYLRRQQTDERKAYMKEYYRKYYQANKHRYQPAAREWYLQNKEKRKRAAEAWKAKNPEKVAHYREVRRNDPQEREKVKARSAAWYRENKQRASKTARKVKLRRYGLTQMEFDAMLESQENACAICRRPAEKQGDCYAGAATRHWGSSGTIR